MYTLFKTKYTFLYIEYTQFFKVQKFSNNAHNHVHNFTKNVQNSTFKVHNSIHSTYKIF